MNVTTGGVLALALTLAACGHNGPEAAGSGSGGPPAGAVHTVKMEPLAASFDASGVAAPVAEATLSTKLMGTVTEVLVREGDRVAAGQPLLRIDARELAAREAQVEASLAEAEAVLREAETQAARMRALFADQAAPKAQVDAAETGLARAESAVRQARAAAAELRAVRDYATVEAPFAGVVVRRFVDPGSFAAPGAPLLTVQDGSRLRITASAPPSAARGLSRGTELDALIEGAPARAVVEGVVPSPAGNLYEVNAIVDNRAGEFLPGSAATLALPAGTRPALTVPSAAVVTEGDLTGVYVRAGEGAELRWVRLGRAAGGRVEVLAGLRDGERVLVPARTAERE